MCGRGIAAGRRTQGQILAPGRPERGELPQGREFGRQHGYTLYEGANLSDRENSGEKSGDARNTHDRLRRESGIEPPNSSGRLRLGFMDEPMEVPDDFDRMGQDRIAELFGAIE